MKVTVDLETAILRSETVVWRLFPGESYSLSRYIQNQEVVFMDLPGVSLPKDFPEENDALVPFLAVADAMKEYHRAKKKRDEVLRPKTDPSTYKNARKTGKRAKAAGAMRRLYSEAAKGDIVLVPAPYSEQAIWIGEFAHHPQRIVDGYADRRYGGEKIPGREVKWLTQAGNSSLPKELTRNIRNQNPFSRVEASFWEDVFQAAYGSFQLEGRYGSSMRSRSENFTELDNYRLAQFSLMLAQALEAADDGAIDNFRFDSFDSISEEYIASLSISVNSPGLFKAVANTAKPLLASAMFSLLINGNVRSTIEAGETVSVEVVNSKSTGTCSAAEEVGRDIDVILSSMGFDRVEELCKVASRLREDVRLESDSRITKIDKK
ncbi:MAG: hypothetical protein AAGI89_07865 [Pseudomonadota bacterium]